MLKIIAAAGIMGTLLAPKLATVVAEATPSANCKVIVERREQAYSVLAINKTTPVTINMMLRKPKSAVYDIRVSALVTV
jgi:hypothetical protein